MYWRVVNSDHRGVIALLASHYALYSRRVIPYPPGQHLILLGEDESALFILHRARSEIRLTARRGYDAWNITAFRNESDHLASDLIRLGLGAGLYCWGDVLPRDGVMTLIDTEHLTPVMRRGIKAYGFCYQRVGFRPVYDDKRLIRRLTLPREALVQIPPVAPRLLAQQPVLL